jgi:hypothetical protein
MADYVMEARIRLRVISVEDEYEGWDRAMEFFQQGLNHLAYSDDPNDDHYEIEECQVLTFKEV